MTQQNKKWTLFGPPYIRKNRNEIEQDRNEAIALWVTIGVGLLIAAYLIYDDLKRSATWPLTQDYWWSLLWKIPLCLLGGIIAAYQLLAWASTLLIAVVKIAHGLFVIIRDLFRLLKH